VVAVVLALSASLCWGFSDFAGGLFSRRLAAVVVVFLLEAGGLVGVSLLLAVTGEPPPDTTSIVYAALAGISGTLGLVCFFRGMAIGAMAVVAPVFAAGTATIPVIVGLATGDALGAVVAVGLVLAGAGIVLASLEGERDAAGTRAGRAAIGFALAGACGAAGFAVGSDVASDGSVLWTLLVARAAALPVVAVVIAASRPRPAVPTRRDVASVAVVGLIDLIATGFYGLAMTKGALAVVAVLGAMYPVITAGLARVVLKERVRRVQLAGVACALLGVVLVAAG
jgi:drug/metabolite transporter (DMT)-like permease